ncbi:MAG: N-acetylglucosamine-6-phosphate deacetylase [Firmicutes bacterium]|nr:N-acetylglucosamine-6-phosphate deacetylase [Bacillota bacterium]
MLINDGGPEGTRAGSALWFEGPVILPDQVLRQGLVLVKGGKIGGLWDLSRESSSAQAPMPAPPDPGLRPGRNVRLHDGYLAPGFIDLHVHGGGGADFADGDPEGTAVAAHVHARHGTTGLLATIMTLPGDGIVRALRALRALKDDPPRGAAVLGFHLEGPFLNPEFRGAHPPRDLRAPSIASMEAWLGESDRRSDQEPDPYWCRQVTLAPELDGASDLIRFLAGRGVVVSAGHTGCTYERLRTAAGEGLKHVTHLFNAMRGLDHREPGPVGGALTLPGLTVELIADGIHVHPAVLALAAAARGPQGIVLVTDAVRAAGMPDGRYRFGAEWITACEGLVRLEDGRLAGSTLTMAGAVRNMVKMAGVPLPSAVAMASLNPARVHGLQDRKGSIEIGKDADLVLLDRDLQVLGTIVEGDFVHETGHIAGFTV